MTALAFGIGLGAFTALASRVLCFDRDRSFFATLLIVIASYYVLFALIGGQGLIPEIAAASAFGALAVAAVMRWPAGIAIGVIAHGLFDLGHGHLIMNPGVPAWWPAFCGGFDVVFGGYALVVLWPRREDAAAD